MPNLGRFASFDGSGRPPRALQEEVLSWLDVNWNKTNIFALNLPTGVGKTAIAHSIQRVYQRSATLVPTNSLLDQYLRFYPDTNFVKGIDHYDCGQDYTCAERKVLMMPPCVDCKYEDARRRAETEATVFNPMSYFYTRDVDNPPDVIIVDEAHKLVSFLMLMVDMQFPYVKYAYPEMTTQAEVVTWLSSVADRTREEMQVAKKEKDQRKVIRLHGKIERLSYILHTFSESPVDLVFYEERKIVRGQTVRSFVVKPINPPSWLLKFLFEGRKLILMSGTLLRHHVSEMYIRDYAYYDAKSPIPKENRRIAFKPAPLAMNAQTDPAYMASIIQKVLDAHPGENTIVHVSYAWSEKLQPFFKHRFNTPETKEEVLADFKEHGGVWFASGCSEGIDLPGDQCRLVIIPTIVMANPHDPFVAARLKQPGGQQRYELETLMAVVQQAGRGTRGEDDWSETVICDGKFSKLVLKNFNQLPKSFLEAITWSTK